MGSREHWKQQSVSGRYQQFYNSKHRPCDSLQGIKVLLINQHVFLLSVYLSSIDLSVYHPCISLFPSSFPFVVLATGPMAFRVLDKRIADELQPQPLHSSSLQRVFFRPPLVPPLCPRPTAAFHSSPCSWRAHISRDRLDHISISSHGFGEGVQKAFRSLGLLTPAASPHFLPPTL